MNALTPRRLALYLLLAPAVMWLLMLIVLPQVEMGILSFRERIGPGQFAPSFKQYATFFAEPLYWNNFLRTAVMSIMATVLALVLAFPVAWTIAKVARGHVKTLLLVGTLLPFWASELVRTLGWLVLLRSSGVIPQVLVFFGVTAQPVELLYNDATIMVGLVYSSLLFMLVPLINSLETLDDSLIEAAYDLGGNASIFCATSSSRTPHRVSRPVALWCSCSPWVTILRPWFWAEKIRFGSLNLFTPNSLHASIGSKVLPSPFCC